MLQLLLNCKGRQESRAKNADLLKCISVLPILTNEHYHIWSFLNYNGDDFISM